MPLKGATANSISINYAKLAAQLVRVDSVYDLCKDGFTVLPVKLWVSLKRENQEMRVSTINSSCLRTIQLLGRYDRAALDNARLMIQHIIKQQ